jgi:hypothetical protein
MLPSDHIRTANFTAGRVDSLLKDRPEVRYLQVMPAKNSRHLTAFVTDEGLYRFKLVCFGIFSEPAAFQKIIKSITTGHDGVVNLLDNVLVHDRIVQEYDQ